MLRPWAHGTFHRPAAAETATHPTAQATDDIWVCKLGWWDGAPWDVRAYAAGHPSYPCDTTLQQLYDGAEFEAYHELGASAVIAAALAPAAEDPLPLLNAASLAGKS